MSVVRLSDSNTIPGYTTLLCSALDCGNIKIRKKYLTHFIYLKTILTKSERIMANNLNICLLYNIFKPNHRILIYFTGNLITINHQYSCIWSQTPIDVENWDVNIFHNFCDHHNKSLLRIEISIYWTMYVITLTLEFWELRF